ncbi:MAG: LON peptidase substrate-binding domain-containing protein, partial [Anaerolineales bacterium]|nr:LON peptidase substrate-binding domain-containing protein [Anaerolineales bacterium]
MSETYLTNMLFRSGLADSMSRQADELYEIPDAEPNDDGLIELPLLPLRDLVMFPHMVTPLFVGRDRSMAAIREANARNLTLIAAAQINPEIEDPAAADLFTVGTEIAVGRMLRMPDGSTSVLSQGRRRVQIVEFVRTEPFFVVRARPIDEPPEKTRETEALMRAVLGLFERVVQLNTAIPEEAYTFALNIEEPGWLADLIASSIELPHNERQGLLEIFEPSARLQRLSILLGKELDVLELED